MEADPIVILSDSLSGGAANSTGRLVEALRTLGATVERWHFSPPRAEDNPNHHSLDPKSKRPPVERVIKNFSRAQADRMRQPRHTDALLKRLRQRPPALVNLRNLHSCGIHHQSLRRLPPELPLVWTMHDCWPFYDCAFRWRDPSTGQEDAIIADNPAGIEQRRQLFAERPDIVMVGPSAWITEHARHELPDDIRVEHIPNGIPTTLFHPRPKAEAKAALGLNPDLTWLAFGSTWASSRKGTDLIPRALEGLDCSTLGLLCWGEALPETFPPDLTLSTHGRVDDLDQLVTLYSAADLFLCPSRADNLPNTVLESLACGTPVVGSNTGGIPDMARPGQTGWLFESSNADAFHAQLRAALDARNEWPAYQERGRQLVEAEFAVEKIARRYLTLYEELIATPVTHRHPAK